MKLYQLIDYSCVKECPEAVLEFATVSMHNILSIRKAVPDDQRDFVEEGDEMAVYAVKHSDPACKRRLTIWFNKEIAAIETSEGSVWGDWDEDEELLLTEEFEKAQDVDDSIIMGRRAYNLYGISGIYASGRFYSLVDECPDKEPKQQESTKVEQMET